MYKNKIRHLALSVALLSSAAITANAAVSDEEAAKLGNELTPMGAIRAGNVDGSIPAWDGGYTKVPANFKQGDRSFDPFAEDKPLYTITAKNLDEYRAKLADGVIQLFKDHPDTFRIDVYPTRRTAAAPQYIYDNTRENATRAVLKNDGLIVEGAYGGVPFPIPKSGLEVHWNHLTLWRGVATETNYKVWTTTASGSRNLATAAEDIGQYPFYYENESYETTPEAKYMLAIQLAYEPAFRAGEALMVHNVLDHAQGRTLWQYLAGQRRVRQAPSINFDTPNVVASGVNFVDETFGGGGSPERYNWELIGKREMIIPYNNNALLANGDETVMGKNHVNPDYMRWEMHRVWEVEATLKDGSRHAVPKRKFYYDEDNWGSTILDGWDAEGNLWRTSLSTAFAAPDIPATVNYCTGFFHDHRTGDWVYNCALGDVKGEQYRVVEPQSESFYTPQSLLRMSGR
jgi:hypothetical protein